MGVRDVQKDCGGCRNPPVFGRVPLQGPRREVREVQKDCGGCGNPSVFGRVPLQAFGWGYGMHRRTVEGAGILLCSGFWGTAMISPRTFGVDGQNPYFCLEHRRLEGSGEEAGNVARRRGRVERPGRGRKEVGNLTGRGPREGPRNGSWEILREEDRKGPLEIPREEVL